MDMFVMSPYTLIGTLPHTQFNVNKFFFIKNRTRYTLVWWSFQAVS